MLHKEAFLKLRNLVRPLKVELGDGTVRQITQVVSMDKELETPAGSVTLKRVEFRILPGASSEILFGRSELSRLKLPSLEESLEAVVAETRSGKPSYIVNLSRDSLNSLANIENVEMKSGEDIANVGLNSEEGKEDVMVNLLEDKGTVMLKSSKDPADVRLKSSKDPADVMLKSSKGREDVTLKTLEHNEDVMINSLDDIGTGMLQSSEDPEDVALRTHWKITKTLS
jgi:hypothetical protein